MLRVLRPLPAHSLRLVVFDLDGTLIDSSRDLCNSVNATLAHFGRKALPDSVISSFIGDGAGMLIRRALGNPDDEVFVKEALGYFLSWYREHKLDYTYAYPGVAESLELLSGFSGRRMAVLTNKPVGPARAICDALGLSRHFFQIYGGDSFPMRKPDPAGLLALMREANAAPEETLMIGDSHIDVLTAREAGAWVIGCTFGLSPDSLEAAQPDVYVDHASGWTTALTPFPVSSQEEGE